MLEKLRQQVCAANCELNRLGLVKLTWGNVSGIDRAKGLVVIKPSGVPYRRLSPSNMVVVKLDGKVVSGGYKPSSDTPTHLELYRAFAWIGGVTHVHSTYATAFAQACRPIPCLGTTHADQFHGDVPLTRMLTRAEVKAAYEVNTGKVIVERFAGVDHVAFPGVLVAGHGPFTWGHDAQDSIDNCLALEQIAAMALATMQINPRIKPLAQYILDKHYLRKHGPSAYYGQRSK